MNFTVHVSFFFGRLDAQLEIEVKIVCMDKDIQIKTFSGQSDIFTTLWFYAWM